MADCLWPPKAFLGCAALGKALQRRAITRGAFLLLALFLLYVKLPLVREHTGDRLSLRIQLPDVQALVGRSNPPETPRILQIREAFKAGVHTASQGHPQAKTKAPRRVKAQTHRQAQAKARRKTQAQAKAEAQAQEQRPGHDRLQHRKHHHQSQQPHPQEQQQQQPQQTQQEQQQHHHQQQQQQQQPGQQQDAHPKSCKESPMLPSCALPEFTLVAGGDLEQRLWQVCCGYAIRLGLRDMGWSAGVRVLWVTGPEADDVKRSMAESVTGPGADGVKGSVAKSDKRAEGVRGSVTESGKRAERGRAKKLVAKSVNGSRGEQRASSSGVSVSAFAFGDLFQSLSIIQSVPLSSPLFQSLLEPLKRTVTVPTCKEGTERGVPSVPAPPTGYKEKRTEEGDWRLVALGEELRKRNKGLNFTVYVSPRHVNFVSFDPSWACGIQRRFSTCFRKLRPTRTLYSLLQTQQPR